MIKEDIYAILNKAYKPVNMSEDVDPEQATYNGHISDIRYAISHDLLNPEDVSEEMLYNWINDGLDNDLKRKIVEHQKAQCKPKKAEKKLKTFTYLGDGEFEYFTYWGSWERGDKGDVKKYGFKGDTIPEKFMRAFTGDDLYDDFDDLDDDLYDDSDELGDGSEDQAIEPATRGESGASSTEGKEGGEETIKVCDEVESIMREAAEKTTSFPESLAKVEKAWYERIADWFREKFPRATEFVKNVKDFLDR